MNAVTVVVLLAFSLGSLWRETNSHAAARRGAAAFEEKKFVEAEAAYRRANELEPSSRSAFNLGTAQIAAGQRELGSASLAAALQDPELRADAFFNRGNSALEAKALDHAIRDYSDALRARPDHAGAKRNLEIALRRREEQQRQSPSPSPQPNPGQKPPEPQPAPRPGQKPGDLDIEALLRSVQQQEQDELRRMKGKAGEARVGW